VRVLVAAASKHGATREIAELIGRAMSDAGLEADIQRVEDVASIDGYDAIILGSAVYIESWMDSAKEFVGRFGAAMTGRPVWLFSSGPLGDPPHPTAEHAVQIDAIVAATGAREHRLFSGRLDPHALSFAERAVVFAVRAPQGDFLDRKAISEWGRAIGRDVAGHHDAAQATAGRAT
jgi:menaquinone-dependent protoporphyrinogen oxidase